MVFIFFLILLLIGFAISVIRNYESTGGWFIGVFLWCFFPLLSYIGHASDLGTIRAQQNIIVVYEARVTTLEKTLESITAKGSTLLNNDKPVASVVDNLSIAVGELAEAKAEKAEAIVSIAKRDAGIFSFIVQWFGCE